MDNHRLWGGSVMSYEPDWNEPSFYVDEGEVCEVCTESPCLCEKEDDDE